MKILKNNKKLILGMLIGTVISGTVVYAATLAASSITYDNTTSGLQATTAQAAIDELTVKANTWINPSYIDFTTLATNTKKTILASKNGICIKRNNKVSCFKVNNWSEEQNHIKQVFSDVSCNVGSSIVGCTASDFRCGVYSSGYVYCYDTSGNLGCDVDPGGSVLCN